MPTDTKKEEFDDRHYPLQEDMRLQRRVWTFERIGWCLLYLLLTLALLGLFSNGILSKARAQNENGNLIVEYQRFERNGAPAQLTLRIKAGKDGNAVIGLDGDFFDNFIIETMQPAPAGAISYGSGVKWVFRPDEQGWATVHLSLRAAGLGLSRSAAASSDSMPVRFSQFIYP